MNSKYAALLNDLSDMQNSVAYALRKHVLMNAERVIVELEKENAALLVQRNPPMTKATGCEEIKEHIISCTMGNLTI